MIGNGGSVQAPPFPRPHRIFGVLLSAWLLFPITVVVFLVVLGLERATHEFEEHSHRLLDDVGMRLRANHSVLNGFAAFMAVVERDDRNEVMHYATSVLHDNPHIYALEVVEEVTAAQLRPFLAEMERAGYHGFAMRDFEYEGARQWRAAQPRDTYYPLSFVLSLGHDLDELLGLDIAQVSFLRPPLQKALNSEGLFASQPFELYEGGKGYALITRVTPPKIMRKKNSSQCLAVVIVRIGDLLPIDNVPHEYAFQVTLRAEMDGNGVGPVQLLQYDAPQKNWVTRHLLPRLRFAQQIEASIPPTTMIVERQLGWRDINLPIVALVIFISAITFALLQVYARAHRRSEQRRTELEELFHYKAHHDELTGLPNRTLIIDRIEQGVRNAQRDHQSIAVLFLDLDGFKPINDTYGHKAGDEVLREVAQRLRTVVRERDTVGRMSGDEFIMVLADTDREGTAVVREKINSVFEAPFELGSGELLSIGISAGFAIYPEDGESVMGLLRVADRDMYRHKPVHNR